MKLIIKFESTQTLQNHQTAQHPVLLSAEGPRKKNFYTSGGIIHFTYAQKKQVSPPFAFFSVKSSSQHNDRIAAEVDDK